MPAPPTGLGGYASDVSPFPTAEGPWQFPLRPYSSSVNRLFLILRSSRLPPEPLVRPKRYPEYESSSGPNIGKKTLSGLWEGQSGGLHGSPQSMVHSGHIFVIV